MNYRFGGYNPAFDGHTGGWRRGHPMVFHGGSPSPYGDHFRRTSQENPLSLIIQIVNHMAAKCNSTTHGAHAFSQLCLLNDLIESKVSENSADWFVRHWTMAEREWLLDELRDMCTAVRYDPQINLVAKVGRLNAILEGLTEQTRTATQSEPTAEELPDPALVFHTLHQMLTIRQVSACTFYNEVREGSPPLTVDEIAQFELHKHTCNLTASTWVQLINQMHADPYYLRDPKAISDTLYAVIDSVRAALKQFAPKKD